MLHSRSQDIGFAHYPKTAGHSLGEWFRSVFPDATFADPPEHYDVSHLPVRASLERLGIVPPPSPRWPARAGRLLGRVARRAGIAWPVSHCKTRVIGVMREPFQMMVSLFEYWRHYPFKSEPGQPLIVTARVGTFHDFVHAAVVDRMLLNYETFFDVGGPAWPSTRLIDFDHLDDGLAAICREFDIPAPGPLPCRNPGPPTDRDLSRYEAAAWPLMADVRRHFRWYYTTGRHITIGGDGPAR